MDPLKGIKGLLINRDKMVAQVNLIGSDRLLFVTDGQIDQIELPIHGEIMIKVQNGKIMNYESRVKNKVR